MSDKPILLTMLNSMAGRDIEASFDRHVAWNLRVLDLKDSLFGKSVEQITPQEAQQIRDAADRRDLRIHTLSTVLCGGDIEQGEEAFRAANLTALQNVLNNASVLRPAQIRLLMASSSKRHDIVDSTVYLQMRHAWVFDCYREAIDRIHEKGYAPVIENECGHCLFSTPLEIAGFFAQLNRADLVTLIWDIQNLWQMGTFPSLAVYESLKPYIGMIHVKGGRTELPGGRLKWKSSLEEASWPVAPIVRQAIADGKSPVICLNPSHGEAAAGYSGEYQNDLAFLRREIKEIE